MMMPRPATAAFAMLCLSGPCWPDDARDAFEAGRAFGEGVAIPDASAMAPSSVPGYETDSPPETQYYGNPSSIGEASAEAATQVPAASTVQEGFEAGGMFVFDPSTDPMFQAMRQAESAGVMQGEYSECQQVTVETPAEPITDRCYENRSPESVTCDDTLTVTIEPSDDTITVDGDWTGGSGDCHPDTWSARETVTCPAGYGNPQPVRIARQAKWDSDGAWGNGTGWVAVSSAVTARTDIDCTSSQCTYRTKGVEDLPEAMQIGPDWSAKSCRGDRWYTRMRLRVECTGDPVVHRDWSGGCADLEARSQ